MNYGDGIYGGMFVSCMYSAAFFEKDPRKIVEAGLACIPARSEYAQTIADVLKWHQQHPGDWTRNWELIERRWNTAEPCPEGALLPFNIDAKLNGSLHRARTPLWEWGFREDYRYLNASRPGLRLQSLFRCRHTRRRLRI